MEESHRERAVSSEPCCSSGRPFDDTTEQTSRKRQKVSRGVSRSRSVDTARERDSGNNRDLDVSSDPMLLVEGATKDEVPVTPTSDQAPIEPQTSSRVTINLRTNRNLESIPSSPPSPSKMVSEENIGTRISMESESDAMSTTAAIETPSSSPSGRESPEIELVLDNGSDYVDQGAVEIITEDDDLFLDPLANFPYYSTSETLVQTVSRLSRFFQYDEVLNDDAFCKLRDWMCHYIDTTSNLESFYDIFSRNRDFWNHLPDIIWALSYRSRFFGEFLKRNNESRLALTEMMCQFARLTGRFVAMDVRNLTHTGDRADHDQEMETGSRPFLLALSFLTRKEEVQHIGRNLETHYAWDWEEDVNGMMEQFEAAGGTVNNLTRLVQALLKLIPHNPKMVDSLTEPCRIVAKIVNDAAVSLENDNFYNPDAETAARTKALRGYTFFNVMSAGLISIIEKHVTFLSPDAAVVHLNSLQGILQRSLSFDNPAARELLDKHRRDHSMLARKQSPRVISMEWKFTVLKKLITSSQMQLRVIGVTTMCSDLLNIYTTGKGLDPTTSPLLLYFAEFVIRNQLVDYIVGIGSHPELINESNNILGFLIVTKTYKPEQTDKIWHTVMTSQDPRVVEAILLRMVMKCLNLYDYNALLYLCKKVSDVPTEAFTIAMREFCQSLFGHLVTKSHHDNAPYVDGIPYEICVRLIRESSIASPDIPTALPDIQSFAIGRLRELLVNGPSPNTRRAIYLGCIQDISDQTATAPGSICVVNALVKQNIATDLRFLTNEHGLTELVVAELESVIDQSSMQPIRHSPASVARRELLLTVIIHQPSTITPELGKRLWDVLVGSRSKHAADRSISWQILNAAVKRTSTTNEFLSACYRDHLPTLPPHCFTNGALDFAQEAIQCWLERTSQEIDEADHTFDSTALEQLWRMILTAPHNTIDALAISNLVNVYVDSSLIVAMSRVKARNIHLALVDRCLGQLKGAAAKLKAFNDGNSVGPEESMDIVISADQFQEQERIFARSLAVLREFLRAYQSKPHFASPKISAPIVAPTGITDGESLVVKYQYFDGNKHSDVKSLTLGALNPAASLFSSLQKATGFKSYKVYCGGREIKTEELGFGRSLEEMNLRGLVLVQSREESDEQPSGKSTLELEIMKHFDDLWSYLGMHEKVAQEIYYFLIKFPVYEKLLTEFQSGILYSEIFLPGQPFKSLYAIHSLREAIAHQSQKGTIEEEPLTRAIILIVQAISDRNVLKDCPSDELRDCLALHFIDCLVQFLREPIIPASITPHLDQKLLDSLLRLLYDAKEADNSKNAIHLTHHSFEAVLEASTHSLHFWKLFASHLETKPLLRDLVLLDPRPIIRKNIVKTIVAKCTFSPSLAHVSTTNFVVAFWPMIGRLIPEAARQSYQCEETLSLAHALFKRLAETSLEMFDLNDLVKEWGAILLSHSCDEKIGQPESIDMVAYGLANLILCAASFAKASEQSVSCGNLGIELFRKHLFPDLSADDDDEELLAPRIPVLNPMTRNIMAEMVYYLVKDDEVQYKSMLASLSALVPYAPTEDGPYVYDLSFGFDRGKSIRSHTGYVGLRNLSNTCYLNSLFTQLFMNIPFRDFMLKALVADGGSSQKLLSETQNLFSYMQNSFKKFVDPTNLAGSITTYEETQIDVTVQMDVDEFYNLLFDRWESQMLAADAKRQFRSFYGGQLVQQVKSKECPHISERLEPFSAIQCDIKGKSTLQESLQAYVDGEVMEGDNKYKCSSCDRHVDAVKRACLKDIPDNLIFHLKRFDFNLRTLQRNKINDHFSFPKEIDMRPYKVEYLMDGPEETPEDMFELVGILVHSGTAESGHYYSYIRERPSTCDRENWVEFNDESVTPWDPNFMESNCFGGPDYRGPVDNGTMPYDRAWSAYMLFYQRSASLASQTMNLERSGHLSPVRLPVPNRLFSHIAMENELLMRKYCIYDPSHATFVTKMLANIKHINSGQCSVAHSLEKLALTSSLNHLDQVIARTRDTPDFPNFMLVLRQICHSCAECSRDYLEWFFDCPETLRQLLIKNPDNLVRNEIAASIVSALNKVKTDASYAYGFGDDDDSVDELEGGDPQIMQRVVKALNKLWDMIHVNMRAWPEYFGLLTNIAKLGKREATLLLDAGFLRKTIEIVTADPLLPLSPQYSRMLSIISKRSLARPVSYDSIINLLCKLLQVCEPVLDAVGDDQDRLDLALIDAAIPFSVTERHLITQHWTRTSAHILIEKLINHGQGLLPQNTVTIMIDFLNWPDSLDENIQAAIFHGIRKEGSSGSFFKAAALYAINSHDPKALSLTVNRVSAVATNYMGRDGLEILHFYKELMRFEPSHTDMTELVLFAFLYDQIPIIAPALLCDSESLVRTSTEDFLIETLFSHSSEVNSELPPMEQDKARIVIEVARKLGSDCLEYLYERYTRPRLQAVRATVETIQAVVRSCNDFYELGDAEDDDTKRFIEMQTSIIPALTRMTVDEPEDEGSDWEGSEADDDFSSEPIDRLGEICSVDDGQL